MPTTQFLDRGPGRIGYDVTGQGPLVVCVPGMGDLRSVYRFLAPALVGAGYRVATMDLRGHGDSDVDFPAYDDVALGGDVLALVEHLEDGPAVLVGNSMAAAAAAWAAAEAPDRVAALVLLGPFVREVPMSRALLLAFRLALRKPWGPAAWLAFYRKAYPSGGPADLAEHRGRIRASLRRPGRWRAFVATSRTSHAPAEARLPEVDVPVLVVMGAKDPDFRDPAAEARTIAELLRTDDVVVVPDAGHYPQAERPEIVAPAVLGFLGRVTARG